MDENKTVIPYPFVEEILLKLEELKLQQEQLKRFIEEEKMRDYLNEYIDLGQAQKMLNCKATTLEKLRNSGDIPYVKFGHKVLIRRQCIIDFLEKHTVRSIVQELKMASMFE